MVKKTVKIPIAPQSPTTVEMSPKLATTGDLKGKEIVTTGPYKFVEPKRKLTTMRSPKQLKMIRQTMSALIQNNHSKVKASKALGITEMALYKRIRNYPIILEQLEDWHQQTVELAKKELKNNTFEAVNTVTGLMTNSNSERIQLDSAIEVLDRSGITKPNTQVQVNVLNDLRKDRQTFDL